MLRIIQICLILTVLGFYDSLANNCCDKEVVCPRDIPGDVVGFYNFGAYEGKDSKGKMYRKQYYVSIFDQAVSINTPSYCQALGLNALNFESEDEVKSFLKVLKKKKSELSMVKETWFAVTTDLILPQIPITADPKCFSLETGKQVSYALPWISMRPYLSSRCAEHLQCVDVVYETYHDDGKEALGTNNIKCNKGYSALYYGCQKIDPCYKPITSSV